MHNIVDTGTDTEVEQGGQKQVMDKVARSKWGTKWPGVSDGESGQV